MPWNPSPHVADLRDLSRKWDDDQIITIGINNMTGQFRIVSFGRTRELCARAKLINDRLAQLINDGTIEI